MLNQSNFAAIFYRGRAQVSKNEVEEEVEGSIE